jgi:hypothetical protein
MVPVLSEQITFTQPEKKIIPTFRFLMQWNPYLKNMEKNHYFYIILRFSINGGGG